MRSVTAIAITKLVDQAKPLLAGKDAEVVGAALADLTAIWLAGFAVPNDPVQTDRIRAEMLAHHLRFIAALVEINAKEIGTALLATPPEGRA